MIHLTEEETQLLAVALADVCLVSLGEHRARMPDAEWFKLAEALARKLGVWDAALWSPPDPILPSPTTFEEHKRNGKGGPA